MAVRLGDLEEGDLFFFVGKGPDHPLLVGEVLGQNRNWQFQNSGVVVFRDENGKLDELSLDAMVTTD